jgi:homopolymeric O-antigen transport system permease protein
MIDIHSKASNRLQYSYDLLHELVVRDLKLRYRRSVLGLLWTLLNPLAQLLVLNLVFRLVLPLEIPNYSLFLFTGLLAWNWFQTSLFAGTGSIVESRELIRRPGFPIAILPVITVISSFIHFLLALPILLLFMFLFGIHFSSAFLALPVVFVFQFVLCLGLIYLLATIQVTFRDTQYLLGVLLFLGFYLTPVFYDSSAIPLKVQVLYRLNPMVTIIDAYRSVFIHAELPASPPLILVGLVSFALLWTTYQIFRKASYRFVEEL